MKTDIQNIQLNKYDSFFFIGIGGAGMSAIALYLAGNGFNVSGSDRIFGKDDGEEIRQKLQRKGIECFPQDGSGLHRNLDMVVISTAIEPTVPEYQKAVGLGIPVVMRSDLLAAVCSAKKTIAVSGTSGKSTVTAMIFHILHEAGLAPSLVTGAGLVSLVEKGEIGNAVAGKGEYLVIEADESDGSLVKYSPEIGLLLNIDKDHKELEELDQIFSIFRSRVRNQFIVNKTHPRAAKFSVHDDWDFGYEAGCGFRGSDFRQEGFSITFKINNVEFMLNQPGRHNAENAMAATAAAAACGVAIADCAKALACYKGIYRRHQIIGTANQITVIDDYAHNPAKLAASVRACQFSNTGLTVWFQPHGFAPTKFLMQEFISEIAAVLRPEDEMIISEIYYAGGTADRTVSAKEMADGISAKGKKALFILNREQLVKILKQTSGSNRILLMTGARDPSLGKFAQEVFNQL